MFENTSRKTLALGLAGALMLGGSLALAYRALAQDGGRSGQPGFQPGGGQFGGAQFGGGFGGPGFMPGGGGGGATMTATSTNVFVLRGNTLYSFDARTLKLISQANLPQPERGPGGPGFQPDGRGGGPGAGGFGGSGFRPQGGRPGGAPPQDGQ